MQMQTQAFKVKIHLALSSSTCIEMQKIKAQYFKHRIDYRKLDKTLLPFYKFNNQPRVINVGSATPRGENIYIYMYRQAPVSADSVSTVSVIRGSLCLKINWKIKEVKVCKFQNSRQARTGRNMVKSSSSNAPST
jgi:hypothetical protein